MARTPIHPGEILADELHEIGLSAKTLADTIEVPPNRLYQIIAGKPNITADTALPLAQYFRSRTFISLMEERLLPGMASRGIVDVGIVRRWWRRALQAPSTTEGFWITVALELWAQQFIDGRHNGSG